MKQQKSAKARNSQDMERTLLFIMRPWMHGYKPSTSYACLIITFPSLLKLMSDIIIRVQGDCWMMRKCITLTIDTSNQTLMNGGRGGHAVHIQKAIVTTCHPPRDPVTEKCGPIS